MVILRERALGEDGDIAYVNGSSYFLEGVEAVRQRITTRLRTFKGEWIFDQRLGTPWFQQILGKKGNETLVAGIVRKRLLESQGVESIPELKVSFDRASRVLTITGRVRTTESQTFDLESVVEVGI